MNNNIIKTKSHRIRKSTYEVVLELLYRTKALLLGKSEEFGKLDSELTRSLSNLNNSLKEMQVFIVKKHLDQNLESERSKELAKTLDLIDNLIDLEVIKLADPEAV